MTYTFSGLDWLLSRANPLHRPGTTSSPRHPETQRYYAQYYHIPGLKNPQALASTQSCTNTAHVHHTTPATTRHSLASTPDPPASSPTPSPAVGSSCPWRTREEHWRPAKVVGAPRVHSDMNRHHRVQPRPDSCHTHSVLVSIRNPEASSLSTKPWPRQAAVKTPPPPRPRSSSRSVRAASAMKIPVTGCMLDKRSSRAGQETSTHKNTWSPGRKHGSKPSCQRRSHRQA